MLYREIIAVCSQIHTKHINAIWPPTGGTQNYHCALEGYIPDSFDP